MRMVKSLVMFAVVAGLPLIAAEPIVADTVITKQDSWHSFVDKDAAEKGGKVEIADNVGKVTVPAIEKQYASKVQLARKVEVDAEKSYTLKFKLNSSKAGKIVIYYYAPSEKYAVINLDIEEGEKEYECRMDVKKAEGDSYKSPRTVRFLLGGIPDCEITLISFSVEQAAE